MNTNTMTVTGLTAATLIAVSLALANVGDFELIDFGAVSDGGPLFDASMFWALLASLFAIMNPLVAVPFFAAITEGHPQEYRSRLALNATFAVMVTLLLAALLGNQILAFFAISIGSFRIAGGIIVLLMGLALIRSDGDAGAKRGRGGDSRSQAVCPIAIPLLAGPGAIAAIIVHCDGASRTADYLTLGAVMLAMVVIVYLTLRLAVPVARFLGDTGLTVATRLFGMIVVAIAIDMTMIGIGVLFPQLLG